MLGKLKLILAQDPSISPSTPEASQKGGSVDGIWTYLVRLSWNPALNSDFVSHSDAQLGSQINTYSLASVDSVHVPSINVSFVAFLYYFKIILHPKRLVLAANLRRKFWGQLKKKQIIAKHERRIALFDLALKCSMPKSIIRINLKNKEKIKAAD